MTTATASRTVVSIRTIRIVVLIVSVLVVFFFQFRPLQNGLLEDWQFAQVWKTSGWNGFWASLPGTIGRPFHLITPFLGLALSNGGFVGMFAVLGIIAVGQFLVVLWAFPPTSRYEPLVWAAGLGVALHPWWAAGDILRYMPAQFSCLAFCFFVALTLRYMRGHRLRDLIVASLAGLIGLLAYQALAITYLAFALLVLLLLPRRSTQQSVSVFLAALLPVVITFIYSVFLAPLLVPNSYEASLGDGAQGIWATLKAIAKTLLRQSPMAELSLVVLAGTTVVIAALRIISVRNALFIVLLIVSSPLSAGAYAANALQLNDPERLSFPIGTTAWLAMIAWPLVAGGGRVTSKVLIAAILTVLITVGASINLVQWAQYSSTQSKILRLIQPAVERADPTDKVLVADSSGTLGDVYTFLPPHLWFASEVENDKATEVDLCTVDGTVKDQPVAERFPIETTAACSVVDTGGAREMVSSTRIDGKPVDVYIVRSH